MMIAGIQFIIFFDLRRAFAFAALFVVLTIQVTGQIVQGDTIIDTRTGLKYPTVIINGTTWMTRNMNVGRMVLNTGQQDNGIIEKTCYDNDSTHCKESGGLYTFLEAMNYNPENSQGICPDCWHVATKEDWEELFLLAGNGNVMQQLKTDINWDGLNTAGFNALPAGLAYDAVFGRKGDWAIFWTSTAAGNDYAWSVEMDNYYFTISGVTDMKLTNTYLVRNAFSIRCVKNKSQ